MSKLTDALNVIIGYAKSNPGALVTETEDAELLKATAALVGATGLDGAPVVEDRWMAGQVHSVPTKEEIKTGPTQAATGGNAEKQIQDYSDPAKQHGVTEIAEKFNRILHVVSAMGKAQTDAIHLLIKSQENMTAIIAKGTTVVKAEEEDDDEGEEESETVEMKSKAAAKSKGIKLLAKAQKALRAIKAHGDDVALEDDDNVKKALSGAIATMKKAVAATLRCASQNAAVAGDIATIKAVLKTAKKADVEIEMEEDEDEDEDEDEKAKAKTAVTAKADDKGNQDASKDDATGNQNDEAAKAFQAATDMVTKSEKAISDALSGVTTLSTDVKGLMGILSGMSRADFKGVTLAKADAVVVEPAVIGTDYDKQISKARAQGSLNEAGAMTARGILEKHELAKSGLFDPSMILTMINKASPEVRAIFADFKVTTGKAA